MRNVSQGAMPCVGLKLGIRVVLRAFSPMQYEAGCVVGSYGIVYTLYCLLVPVMSMSMPQQPFAAMLLNMQLLIS